MRYALTLFILGSINVAYANQLGCYHFGNITQCDNGVSTYQFGNITQIQLPTPIHTLQIQPAQIQPPIQPQIPTIQPLPILQPYK